MWFAVIISRNQSWLLAPAECKLQSNVPHSLLTQPLGRLPEKLCHVASVSTCNNNNHNQGGCVFTCVHLFVSSQDYGKTTGWITTKVGGTRYRSGESPSRVGADLDQEQVQGYFFNIVRLFFNILGDFSEKNSWILIEKRWKRFMTEDHSVQIQIHIQTVGPWWRYALDQGSIHNSHYDIPPNV